AMAKAQMAAQPPLPLEGNVFLSVKPEDKARAVNIGRELVRLGYTIFSTAGTALVLEDNNIPVQRLFKLSEGARPNVLDMLKNDEVALIINTPSGQTPRVDENVIRSEAVMRRVCIMTTITGAEAALEGIKALKDRPVEVRSIQEYSREL
ncbi:MAG: carbamoyl phosphate synthase large subunit, partial [Verrucomicrobiota bacterium]